LFQQPTYILPNRTALVKGTMQGTALCSWTASCYNELAGIVRGAMRGPAGILRGQRALTELNDLISRENAGFSMTTEPGDLIFRFRADFSSKRGK
jgi:hypothetical protein